MMPEDEDSFTFVDRRQSAGEGRPAPDDPQAASAAEDDDSAPYPDGDMGGAAMHHLTGRDRLLMSIDILQQGAWISLGLRPDPITRNVAPDLREAKELIDCVNYLAERAVSKLDAETQRDLRTLLRDLQLNYVQQVNR